MTTLPNPFLQATPQEYATAVVTCPEPTAVAANSISPGDRRRSETRVSIERVSQLILYDPDDGTFVWREQRGYTAAPGKSAGCVTQHRYLQIRIDRTSIMAHRIAWAIMTGSWPSNQIDHINCNGLDNRFSNLREATSEQNAWNKKRSTRNKSGFKGVSWNKSELKWVASIRCRGSKIHLGYFDVPEVAHSAYHAAAQKLFQQFSRAA